jgi:hypothetical protein
MGDCRRGLAAFEYDLEGLLFPLDPILPMR